MTEFTVLGLETSCDETAAAVVRGRPPGPGNILSNIVASQVAVHAPYGGVVPEIAARAHVEMLDEIVLKALGEAGVDLADLDAIAATAGPGLIGGVMIGLTTAKALALASGKPLIAVNHLQAHALTARMTAAIAFPFLLLLISGGHCQVLACEGVGTFRLYGATVDDSVGEAFDKVAKVLGLPYPGGPQIERLAVCGNAAAFRYPRPMRGRDGADFSFSGLKTAVRLSITPECNDADIAASFQAAVTDVLADRTQSAMKQFAADYPNSAKTLVVAGGVAANQAIAKRLALLCGETGFRLAVPPSALCTDNAAMVAWTGVEKLAADEVSGLDVSPKARWPLVEEPA